jgi:hypothetical protein
MQVLLEVCSDIGSLSSLRHVNCGGEAVTPAAVGAMCAVAPNAQIYDTYGVLWTMPVSLLLRRTQHTIWCSWHTMQHFKHVDRPDLI